MARQNVTSAKAIGWIQVIDRRMPAGWAYRHRVTLECGHVLSVISETFPDRMRDVAPPAWVICRECEEAV